MSHWATLAIFMTLLLFGCGGHKGTRTDKDYSTDSDVGTGGNFNMGESIYKIVRKNVSQSPTNPVEKVEALETKRVDFIASVNSVFTDEVRSGLKPTLKTSIELIKDDTLPSVTEDMKAILDSLLEDEATLEAMARLGRSKRGLFSISNPNVMALLARLTHYPEIEDVYKAISHIVEENESVVEETLRFISEFLKEIEDESEEESLNPHQIHFCDVLLNHMEIKPGAELGFPEYEVRIDVHGNPVVNINPTTQKLFEPFVDQDEDGLADTNAEGKCVDTEGRVIEIAAFGADGSRDEFGRALSSDGALLYEYFDVKRTFLALLMQLAGSSLKDGMVDHVLAIANGILGDRVLNDNHTVDTSDDYQSFPYNDNPVLDMIYGYLELYKYEHSPKTLKALSNLFKERPEHAERVLVAVGKLLRIIRDPQFKQNIQTLHDQVEGQTNLFDEVLPLIDELFQTPSHGGESTARILFRTFNERIQELRGLPKAYGKMFRYSNVLQQTTTEESGEPSAYERLTHIIWESDQCTAPIVGNLAEFYVSVMAGPVNLLGVQVPFTIDNINAIIEIPFIRKFLCPIISDENVLGLLDLRRSGGVDALLPLAQTLVPMGETRLLIEMHNIMHEHYDLIRPNEKLFAEIFDSGAIEALFDVINIMSEVEVPGTEEVVADVLVDSIANLVRKDENLRDRLGRPVPTLLHLLLNPMRELENRAEVAGLESHLEAFFYSITDYLIQTEIDDKGTVSPDDDEEFLVYKTLVPVISQTLEVLANQLSDDPEQRRNDLVQQQLDFEEFMTGRGLPALIDFLNVLNNSSVKQDILDAVINLLTPHQDRSDDIFGAVAKVIAREVQFFSVSDQNALNQMLRFAGKILDPEKGYMINMIQGYKRLIVRDEGSIALSLVRNLFYQGDEGDLESPAQVFIGLFEKMSEIDGKDLTRPTKEDVRENVQSIQNFLKDKKNGVEMIFNTIKKKHGVK